jgi:hypothetical protein
VHISGSFSFYVDVFIPQPLYPSRAPEFIHAFFVGVRVAHVLGFFVFSSKDWKAILFQKSLEAGKPKDLNWAKVTYA